jgi:hypothetical protein
VRPCVTALSVCLLVSACGPQPPGRPVAFRPAEVSSPPADSALLRALSRIADTDMTRKGFAFGDTAALRGLPGRTDGNRWSSLVGVGQRDLAGLEAVAGRAGIHLAAAEYAISTGVLPDVMSVLAGGQHEALARDGLTAAGWQPSGDGFLVAPPQRAEDSHLVLAMPKALPRGTDLLYGEQSTVAANAWAEPEESLARAPEIVRIADCLGDVVAAVMVRTIGRDQAVSVSVGIRRPRDATETGRVVICSAWPDAAAAQRSATAQRDGYATGSTSGNLRYDEVFTEFRADVLDGPRHMVRAEAGYADPRRHQPSAVLSLLQNNDLPGLPIR